LAVVEVDLQDQVLLLFLVFLVVLVVVHLITQILLHLHQDLLPNQRLGVDHLYGHLDQQLLGMQMLVEITALHLPVRAEVVQDKQVILQDLEMVEMGNHFLLFLDQVFHQHQGFMVEVEAVQVQEYLIRVGLVVVV
jgi:hypothetical protein